MYYMKCLHKDVIRASGAGAFTILRRIKRFLQMMALIIIVACMTSVLYQNVHGLKDLEVNVCMCVILFCQRQFSHLVFHWFNVIVVRVNLIFNQLADSGRNTILERKKN